MAIIGKALPPSEGIIEKIAELVGCEGAVIDAIIRTETASHAFDPSKRLIIRPEFGKIKACPLLDSKQKLKALKLGAPKLLSYERDALAAGNTAWAWLDKFAMEFGEESAFWITSFGAPQIMGFNFTACKFSSPSAMVRAFADEEDAQLLAMGEFILANGLKDACRQRKWPTIARLYNGPAYDKNDYDTKLANAYADSHYSKSQTSTWPEDDVLEMGAKGEAVRALQTRLVALGFHLNADGDFGAETRDAVRAVQFRTGQPVDGKVGPLTQRAIASAAPKDPPSTPVSTVIAGSSTAQASIAQIATGGVAATVAVANTLATPSAPPLPTLTDVDGALKTAEQGIGLSQKILSIGVDKLLIALAIGGMIFGAIALYRRVSAHYARKIG